MYCITNFFHNVSVEWKMPLMQCVALCMESQSMGMGKFQSPPTKSIPLNRLTRNLAQLITSTRGPPIPNLVEIHPQGASGKMGEI